MKLDLSFWTNASSKRKRIYSTIIILAIGVFLLFMGSLVRLSPQYAKQITNNVNQTHPQHQFTAKNTAIIFSHNLFICLMEFVPVIGPIWGFVSFFLTGIGISAISIVKGHPPILVLMTLSIFPFTWLEFASYSIAIAESIWLFRRLLQGRWRELKNTAILIGICAILLLIAATVEMWLISIGV